MDNNNDKLSGIPTVDENIQTSMHDLDNREKFIND